MYVNKLKKVKIIIDKKCCLQSAMLHLFCEDIVVIVVVVTGGKVKSQATS